MTATHKMGMARRTNRPPGAKRRNQRIATRSKAEITARYTAFARAYIRNPNATEAALAAGYKEGPGIHAQASHLLSHPKVRAIIEQMRAELAKTYGLELDEWMAELKAVARSDIRKLFNPVTNQLLPVSEWPADMMPAIAGYRGAGVGTPEAVKLQNSLAAIIKLVDMASGLAGKPTTAVQVNVTLDRDALNQERVQQLYGRYFREDGSAKPIEPDRT